MALLCAAAEAEALSVSRFSTSSHSSRSCSLALRTCLKRRRTSSSVFRIRAAAAKSGTETETKGAASTKEDLSPGGAGIVPSVPEDLSKDIAKVVKQTASTFAPRASTKSKNPAVPGSILYQIFEFQAYVSMALGGLLSFNVLFPSEQPDLWRLMGMWSVWMFTVPSLRARDCPDKEKTALNYLFLVIPLINVTVPLVWKSFAAVWTADVVAFLAFYAWKMEWLSALQSKEDQ